MEITFELLVVAGALICSMVTNVLILRHHEKSVHSLLARVQSSDRVVLGPTLETAPHTPQERLYIADHPADDEAWNEFRGEPDPDIEDES